MGGIILNSKYNHIVGHNSVNGVLNAQVLLVDPPTFRYKKNQFSVMRFMGSYFSTTH